MGFSGRAKTRFKKCPCNGPCKRKSYETICENIVFRYQTLVSSLPRETTFRHRRPKADFKTETSNHTLSPGKLMLLTNCKTYFQFQRGLRDVHFRFYMIFTWHEAFPKEKVTKISRTVETELRNVVIKLFDLKTFHGTWCIWEKRDWFSSVCLCLYPVVFLRIFASLMAQNCDLHTQTPKVRE